MLSALAELRSVLVEFASQPRDERLEFGRVVKLDPLAQIELLGDS